VAYANAYYRSDSTSGGNGHIGLFITQAPAPGQSLILTRFGRTYSAMALGGWTSWAYRMMTASLRITAGPC
jgi:hypothetical protein